MEHTAQVFFLWNGRSSSTLILLGRVTITIWSGIQTISKYFMRAEYNAFHCCPSINLCCSLCQHKLRLNVILNFYNSRITPLGKTSTCSLKFFIILFPSCWPETSNPFCTRNSPMHNITILLHTTYLVAINELNSKVCEIYCSLSVPTLSRKENPGAGISKSWKVFVSREKVCNKLLQLLYKTCQCQEE